MYQFTCQGDPELFYIGQTSKNIIARVEEHMAIAADKPTAVGQHINGCKCCMSALKKGELGFKSFEILHKCHSRLASEVKEAFSVRRKNPLLNTQLFQSGASVKLKIFG